MLNRIMHITNIIVLCQKYMKRTKAIYEQNMEILNVKNHNGYS